DEETVDALIDQGRRWLDAGALQLVIEARESACGVGLFDQDGHFNPAYADRFVDAFGHEILMFEAPNKASQFALLNYFGREVHLCNVRLEESLRVEIYRRGLHSDAFAQENLRPYKRALTMLEVRWNKVDCGIEGNRGDLLSLSPELPCCCASTHGHARACCHYWGWQSG